MFILYNYADFHQKPKTVVPRPRRGTTRSDLIRKARHYSSTHAVSAAPDGGYTGRTGPLRSGERGAYLLHLRKNGGR